MANIEPLRPFQEEDVPYFLIHPKSMILYEPRLGKTVVTCNVLAADPKTSTILIACSKNAISVWIDHLETWFKELQPDWKLDIRVVTGKGSSASLIRQEIWERPKKEGYITVFLVTFAALLNDWEFMQKRHITTFDTIIGDEVHKVLRNRKTKTTGIFKYLVKNCRRFHALSGTLVGKWGPADYYNLLNIINPYEFSSYWRFVDTWCILVEGMWGKEIIGPKNRENFHRMMSRFSRIRDRKTYGPQMPKVVRDLMFVELPPNIKQVYDSIGETSYALTPNGNIILARNSLEKAMRKRQLLTCPALLDPSLGAGIAIETIIEGLNEAKENEDVEAQHIVIFTMFRKAIGHFVTALNTAGYTNIDILVGGTEPEDLVQIVKHFKATKGIMICTTQFAQAFSLDTSRLCYHIGWSWDPNDNKQAEDRLVAQTGDYSINSYYLAVRRTDDDWMATSVTQKNRNIRLTNTDPRVTAASADNEGQLFREGM